MKGMQERLNKELETRLKTFKTIFDPKIAEVAVWLGGSTISSLYTYGEQGSITRADYEE